MLCTGIEVAAETSCVMWFCFAFRLTLQNQADADGDVQLAGQ